METTAAFRGLACPDCGGRHEPADAPGRCPDCGGPLDPEYDLDAVDADAFRTAGDGGASMWDYDALLPFPGDASVSLGEGATPLVECPRLADELDVERVLLKDEGRNPTGSVADRGMSLAVTAAAAAGASDVALASTGDDGQAAAAYAGRAGLDARVAVPARAGFVQKAMINVHGGDMSVVEGRLPEAREAHEAAVAGEPGWHSVDAAATAYRHEGWKTLLYEVVAALDSAPDAVVLPTGEGAGIVGVRKAAVELHEMGLSDEVPNLFAAQASGCAPIVRAIEHGGEVEPWPNPDTICAGIEVPDPAAGDRAVAAVRATDGGGVATDDDEILASAVAVAEHEGVPTSPSGAAAPSGAWTLAERGAFDPGDTVVLVNTADGSKTADVLRSHLMGRGV